MIKNMPQKKTVNKIKLINNPSFIILFKCICFIFFISFIFLINNINYYLNDNFMAMQKFIYLAKNGSLINPKEKFYKSDYPKISIIIAIYNAAGYIKNALLSIENQDFKDVEIIMVDDGSKDNSVNLIKNFMKKDPRIVLP